VVDMKLTQNIKVPSGQDPYKRRSELLATKPEGATANIVGAVDGGYRIIVRWEE
jgi:hypothetical protein